MINPDASPMASVVAIPNWLLMIVLRPADMLDRCG
jgi:hypothetical protein